MASSYYKGTPYGWCLDHYYVNGYNAESWQQYVEKIAAFLNPLKVNYSVIHYKSIVRVHVFFSAIKKMGYRNAVDLYWLAFHNKYANDLDWGWSHRDVENHVKKYFIENDLEIKMEGE